MVVPILVEDGEISNPEELLFFPYGTVSPAQLNDKFSLEEDRLVRCYYNTLIRETCAILGLDLIPTVTLAQRIMNRLYYQISFKHTGIEMIAAIIFLSAKMSESPITLHKVLTALKYAKNGEILSQNSFEYTDLRTSSLESERVLLTQLGF